MCSPSLYLGSPVLLEVSAATIWFVDTVELEIAAALTRCLAIALDLASLALIAANTSMISRLAAT